jgi:hypothetical protein
VVVSSEIIIRHFVYPFHSFFWSVGPGSCRKAARLAPGAGRYVKSRLRDKRFVFRRAVEEVPARRDPRGGSLNTGYQLKNGRINLSIDAAVFPHTNKL